MNTPIAVRAPASKSLSHRFFLAAGLAGGESLIANVLESEDTARTRALLEALGAVFTPLGPGRYRVRGLGGAPFAHGAQPENGADARIGAKTGEAKAHACPGEASPAQGARTENSAEAGRPLDCFVGESGTTCRLITAILAAGHGSFYVHGAGRMHERPMRELNRVLEQLGARFCYEEKEHYPPFVLQASGLDASLLEKGMADLGADESSQYFSGLLLAAPLSSSGLTIRLTGEKAVSWPYIGLTLDVMERFNIRFSVEEPENGPAENDVAKNSPGHEDAPAACAAGPVRAEAGTNAAGPLWKTTNWRLLQQAVPGRLRFRINPGTYQAGEHVVEGDWSGASYFLAAGAIGPAPVRVEGLKRDSLQGDAAILGILQDMGASIQWDAGGVTVFPALLRGITVDMGQCPDLAPTVAAVAAHAKGPTRIKNAAHLRIKESDRLAAPAAELAKAGCTVTVLEDGLLIEPPLSGPQKPEHGLVFNTHDDHRMAMSLSLLGLPGLSGGPGFAVELDNPGCVAKSFPSFWDVWKKVLP